MDSIKKTWMQIRAGLDGLNPSQKWLIGTLIVLAGLVVSILLSVAAQPETVSISQFASGRSEEVLARLQAQGIEATREGNQIRVPKSQEQDAILALVEDDLLSDNAAAAFDQLVSSQNPWTSDAQNQQAYQVAKQKVLSGILRKMKGVRSADVVLDRPRNMTFGANYVRPSASVTITTNGNVNAKQLVEAVAGLVSGAVAEMSPSDVKVIIDGRIRKANDPNDALPSDRLEYVHSLEAYHQAKIAELLSYIPGVRVGVSVQLDTVRTRSEVSRRFEESEPLQESETEEMVRQNLQQAGDVGVRPNAGLDIGGGGATGTSETVTRQRDVFGPKALVHEEQTTHTGQVTNRINVAINVPRAYFVQIWKGLNPDKNEAPDDNALQPIVTEQLGQIQRLVEPLVQTAQSDGQVATAMIPDETYLARIPSEQTQTAGMGVMFANVPWTKPVGIGALALLSLGLMLFIVRRANQQEDLPTVEELAGVPPRLPTDEELIGEAEETEATMAGVVVNEDELQSRKIAEQISDLIKANPDEAGTLLSRWVRRDE